MRATPLGRDVDELLAQDLSLTCPLAKKRLPNEALSVVRLWAPRHPTLTSAFSADDWLGKAVTGTGQYGGIEWTATLDCKGAACFANEHLPRRLLAFQNFIRTIRRNQRPQLSKIAANRPLRRSTCFCVGRCGYSLSYTDSTVDLQLVNGPDPANTTRALSANRANLQNVMAQRTAALAGMMDYDCPAFDRYGVCLSFQARYGAMESMNDGAGVLTAAYRLSPHMRLGGFIDQGVTRKAPADLRLNPQQPSFGLFLGFNQRTDGLGLQGRISAALNQIDVGVTRDAGLASTEPGSGKARLGGSAAAIELGYGVAWAGSLTATPYMGFRHTQVTRAAYREAAAAGTVENPIAYGAFQQRLGAATAGLRLNGMMDERTGYQLGAGLDYYAYGATGVYAGTSAIYGLEAFALPGAGPARRMSPEASAGLFHQLGRMQRLTINFSMRGQAFSSRAAVSVLAGYQAAF